MRRSIGRKHTHTPQKNKPLNIINTNVSFDLPPAQLAFVSKDRYHRGEAENIYEFSPNTSIHPAPFRGENSYLLSPSNLHPWKTSGRSRLVTLFKPVLSSTNILNE